MFLNNTREYLQQVREYASPVVDDHSAVHDVNNKTRGERFHTEILSKIKNNREIRAETLVLYPQRYDIDKNTCSEMRYRQSALN